MRNKLFINILFLSLSLLGASGCTRESLPESSSDCTGVETLTRLSFAPEENAIVVTKAAVTALAENRVLNLFVFLFDSEGNKIYSQYFDSANKKNVTSTSSLTTEGWWVSNSETLTQGGVCFNATSGSGYKIYAMANLDADMVRVSSDLLSHNIDSEQDLKNFSVYLNQEITSRNGYFPMTGMLSDLKIADNGTITKTDGSAAGTLMLRRLDAKVKFVFKTGSRADATGAIIKSFTAKQWKVVNLPSTSYLVERDSEDSANVPPTTSTSEYVNYAPKFFDSDWTNFEEFPSDSESSFTFYMLENRQSPKNSAITSYQDRSRQVKYTEGYNIGQNESVNVSYVNSRGMEVSRDMKVFSNANDFSAYVLVTGRVEMELDEDDNAGSTLGGDVQYLIHLGNWSYTAGTSWDTDTYGSFNDFNTNRNTFYTYTVTVNSVNNICDAHYFSKTMTFHAANFFEGYESTADDLTWSVKTPFSDGTPTNPLTPGTLDYDWVHFRLNKKNSDGTYNENRRKFVDPSRKFQTYTTYRSASENAEGDGTDGLAGYHNDGLMNVVDLVKYIKEQVTLLETYRKNPGMTYTGDFDNPDDISEAKICVTAFVDEYYYDKNPVTGVSSPTLWKKFVNQSDRCLNILCNSNVSKDLESRATGSVITIQQHSIQSIYNTSESETSLQSAWGIEYTDEFTNEVYTYNTSSTNYSDSGNNTSEGNGLYNSVKEWGLSGTSKWGTYLEFETQNDVPQMQSSYKALRYICLSRNRDNNGNGTIDPDELRWYTASIRQLVGIYVGGGVLDHNSRLYYRSAAEQASSTANVWRQHIISSTNNGGEPTTVWGEEGISTGKLSGSISWGGGLNRFGVRCVRNLGLSNPTTINISATDCVPDDYVEVETTGSGNDAVYTFKATYLNDAALRYYTSRELDYHSNTSDINRLYKRFEVLPTSKVERSSEWNNFNSVNTTVNTAINAGNKNPYCPEGYRLPNQAELAMMKYYNAISAAMVSRTYWSLGVVGYGGSGKDEGNKYGFIYNGGNMSLESSAQFTYRCVRDIRTD